MHRPLLPLLRVFWPTLEVLGWVLASSLILSTLPLCLLYGVWAIADLLRLWRLRDLWRFGRRVRQFRTATARRVDIHYAAPLGRLWDFQEFGRQCDAAVDELASRFGFRLRRRAAVYVLQSSQELGELFRRPLRGIALVDVHAVALTDDLDTGETLTHEVAHLYAARWSRRAPPLLQEGLAVWLQGTSGGRPVDAAAVPLLRDGGPGLHDLLKPGFFFDRSNCGSHYLLAGSFTGFLVRRFGWDRYRDLYRRAKARKFPRTFEKVYGISLERAERRWRDEVLTMDVLGRRMTKGLRQ
jgi:hypothetical protein